MWLRLKLRFAAQPVINRHRKSRLLASLSQLLERIGNLQQRGFTPGAPEERDANRQPPKISRSDVNIWIASDGSGIGTATRRMIAIDQVGEPCRPSRWSHERVKLEFVHDEVDTFGAS